MKASIEEAAIQERSKKMMSAVSTAGKLCNCDAGNASASFCETVQTIILKNKVRRVFDITKLPT